MLLQHKYLSVLRSRDDEHAVLAEARLDLDSVVHKALKLARLHEKNIIAQACEPEYTHVE